MVPSAKKRLHLKWLTMLRILWNCYREILNPGVSDFYGFQCNEAIKILETTAIDFGVTDLKMPGPAALT